MIIAVTGGLGSGKSTVSKILAVTIAAELVDTDEICRQQMQPGNPGFEEFVRCFGNRYLCANGSLDRPLLRQAVFTDNSVKTDLEMILHPLVRKQVTKYASQSCAVGKNLVVEVPLLFESGWQEDYSVWVVVHVPENVCFDRVRKRDGFTTEEIHRICRTQMSPVEKVKLAHFVIENGGTFVSTVQQVAWVGKNLGRR